MAARGHLGHVPLVVEGLIVESWAIFDLPRMLLPLGVDLLKGGAAPAATSTSMRAAATGGTSGGSASGTVPDDPGR